MISKHRLRGFGSCTGALAVSGILASAGATAQTSTWGGGAGGWFNLNNISNGCQNWSTCAANGTGTPGEGGDTFNVDITAPGSAVDLNGGAVIRNLTIGSAASVSSSMGGYLSFDPSCGSCGLLNNGGLTLNGDSYININTSQLTVSGAGIVTMAGATSTIASSPGIGATLLNQETIQGQGRVGLGETALINQGTINADLSGGTLAVQSDAVGLTNTGLLEASGGGTLSLIQSANVPLNNSGGTIEALNGSTVMNAAGVITGGILTTSGSGVIESSGGNPVLHDLTNAGIYVIPLNNLATLEGTIDNTGTIAVGSSAGNGTMYIEGNVTLSGSGTVRLVDAGIAQSGIHSLAAGAQLINQNTIQGAGVIGDAGLTVVNQAAIIANSHDPLAFTDAGFTNTSGGLVQATNGATLNIFSPAFDNQGTLQVDAGSTINFNGNYKLLNYNSATNTLTGGTYTVAGTIQFNNAANGIVAITTNAANLTLNGANAQILDAVGGDALAGLTTNAAGGSLTIENGRNFTSAGDFLNAGALTVGGASTFEVGAGGAGVYSQSGAPSVTNILRGGVLQASGVNWTGGAMNVSGTLDPLSLHVCATCTLTGTGTVVADVSSDGSVAPGTASAPGTLTISGNYQQSATGKLVIDLAGAAAGQYSVLEVSGNAAPGGAVDFVATGGFHPASGEEFTFLLFGTESGSFSQSLFTNWSCPSGATCSEVLGSHSLSLDISGTGGGGGGTGVPEPPTWLLALSGLSWLVARRRWVKRSAG